MNVIFGAGGFAREVAWLIDELVKSGRADGKVDAFVVDDHAGNVGAFIHGVPVISETEFFETCRSRAVNVYIGVGSPQLKQVLHKKCLSLLDSVDFPSLVHPSVIMDLRPGVIQLSEGCFICAGTILTTDLRVGAFVHINLDCTVGHDANIGDFTTLSPGVHISGRVTIGEKCFAGTGAAFLESVHVIDNAVIGAGAVVISDITEPGTWVGVPARRLRS